MAHIVRFFPYRFRIVGVLAAGAFGGSLSVFTQKAYYNKWIKPAPVVTIVPEPASSGEIGSGAVSRSVVEEVKPVHTPKSVLPIQPPPTIEGASLSSQPVWMVLLLLCVVFGWMFDPGRCCIAGFVLFPCVPLRAHHVRSHCVLRPCVLPEVLPAELPPTSTLFDRVRRLADRESLENTLPEVITDMSAYRYTVVDPVVSLDPSADEVGSSSNDAGLETAPTFHFEANVSEVLHRDGERPTTR
jgi:hypothetical protein